MINYTFKNFHNHGEGGVMTESIYSHKNQKYKPLTKVCMKELLSFFRDLEKMIEAKGAWSLEDISTSLESFGRSVAPILNRGDKNFGSKFTVTERGIEKIKKYNLTIGNYEFSLSKNEIKTIYNILKKLKESIVSGRSRRAPFYDFLFLGEQREISNNIVNDLTDLPRKTLARLVKGTLIPSTYFEEYAIDSIKKGSDQNKMKEGLNIVTTAKFSYVLVPLSDTGYEILQAFHVKPEKLSEPMILGGYKVQLKWSVPSIFNEDFTKLTQVVLALLVQYYVGFLNFDDITTCCECNRLTFKNKKGMNLCADVKCYRKYWKNENPRSARKTTCRKNQNMWMERKTGRDSDWKKDEEGREKLSLKPSVCVDCKVTTYPPGGQCLELRKHIKNLDELVKTHHENEAKYSEARKSG